MHVTFAWKTPSYSLRHTEAVKEHLLREMSIRPMMMCLAESGGDYRRAEQVPRGAVARKDRGVWAER